MKKDLKFEELIQLYNHIGAQEMHFNTLELEYRKLASHWLLVSLGAIGFIITKENLVPINIWAVVIAICIAATIDILVLWLLDLKVYHELLHSAFREGVLLEKEYQDILPQIRNRMKDSQTGGDILKRVMLYYFFSVLVLIVIANISVWMLNADQVWIKVLVNIFSTIIVLIIYKVLTNKTSRTFLA